LEIIRQGNIKNIELTLGQKPNLVAKKQESQNDLFGLLR
jgi:hypothetical protein